MKELAAGEWHEATTHELGFSGPPKDEQNHSDRTLGWFPVSLFAGSVSAICHIWSNPVRITLVRLTPIIARNTVFVCNGGTERELRF